jgi:glucose-6-phosphate dehydrogenase assembly protein OpcA
LQDRTLFRKLVELSSRVIIDSAGFNNPGGDLKGLATILKETPKWTAISDLNWARLTAWRGLLAGFYDVQEYRPLLDQLDRIVIEHSPPDNADAPVAARALLLAGWLSSRLGWKLVERVDSGASIQFAFDASARKLTLEFKPTERKIEPGRLASVTVHSAVDETASFAVRRSTDSSRIETVVKLGAESRGKRVLGYESLSESALIGKELDILGNDRVYEQAVIGASDLVS